MFPTSFLSPCSPRLSRTSICLSPLHPFRFREYQGPVSVRLRSKEDPPLSSVIGFKMSLSSGYGHTPLNHKIILESPNCRHQNNCSCTFARNYPIEGSTATTFVLTYPIEGDTIHLPARDRDRILMFTCRSKRQRGVIDLVRTPVFR